MAKGTRVLVPQGVDAIGEWYQPYLHSSARTFNQSRKNYYSNFTLRQEIEKAREISKTIFTNLKKFYSDREKQLADFLGIDANDMTKEGFLTGLLKNIKSDLAGQTGAFPRLSGVGQKLRERNEIKEEYIKDYRVTMGKAWKNSWSRILQGAKRQFTKNEQMFLDIAERDALVIAREIDTDIRELLKEKGVSFPDEIIRAFVINITIGSPIPKSLIGEVNKLRKVLADEVQQLQKFSKTAPGQIRPIALSDRKSSNYGKVKERANLAGQIQNPLGNLAEDTAVYQLNRKTKQGMSNIFEFLLSTSSRKNKAIKPPRAFRVGDKQRRTKDLTESEVFVDDAVIRIENEFGETMDIGIDIKSYANQEKNISKGYKYGRGAIVKKPWELTTGIIPYDKFVTYMYLTANSYFYQKNLFDQLLGEPGGGGVGELYELINYMRGIYGLLPAAPVDFSSMNLSQGIKIADFVKQDTRMFVEINDRVWLMTQFLDEVGGQALTEGKVSNTVLNLSRTFTDALKSFTSGNYIRTGLKKEKKDYLFSVKAPRFWEQTPSQALSYYSQLHENFIAPKLGSSLKNNWKYKVKTEFIIK